MGFHSLIVKGKNLVCDCMGVAICCASSRLGTEDRQAIIKQPWHKKTSCLRLSVLRIGNTCGNKILLENATPDAPMQGRPESVGEGRRPNSNRGIKVCRPLAGLT